ncbi:MAG: hypothetical protein ACI8QC_003487 [Planctomycetota bacterium]|jgi:hypothetical protein
MVSIRARVNQSGVPSRRSDSFGGASAWMSGRAAAKAGINVAEPLVGRGFGVRPRRRVQACQGHVEHRGRRPGFEGSASRGSGAVIPAVARVSIDDSDTILVELLDVEERAQRLFLLDTAAEHGGAAVIVALRKQMGSFGRSWVEKKSAEAALTKIRQRLDVAPAGAISLSRDGALDLAD